MATREQARGAVESGRVLVSGALASKPSRLVSPGEPVELRGRGPRFVSRGGDKLDAALDRFELLVAGACALDAGASTGGFTDCLLQRGAAQVVAVDVGHGQLDARLRADPRVRSLERTNLRHLSPADVGGEMDLVVADLSFISLRLVAAPLVALARPGADLVVLVKPQFEAGRSEADRAAGVIRDPAVWRRVLQEVIASFRAQDAAMMNLMVSPVTGARGNVEFLAHLSRALPGSAPPISYDTPHVDLEQVVAEAAAQRRI